MAGASCHHEIWARSQIPNQIDKASARGRDGVVDAGQLGHPLAPFFSPGDSRVASFPSAAAAAFAVAGRSAPASITMPLPSKVSTSGHPSGAGSITLCR